MQQEIFNVIHDSGKHLEVYQEHPIPLLHLSSKRKTHKVDILIVNEHTVIAINSKGKSFNSTESEDSKLAEYLRYREAIQLAYPDKHVEYIILKDEYDPTNSSLRLYHYLSDNDIPVHNTEEFLKQYGIDFEQLEQRRQDRAVTECERILETENINLELLYEAFCEMAGR